MLTDADRLRRQKERPAIQRLWQALQPLRSVVTFLHTGAHPDDESTALLAALRLGDGVRTVFVCATRGEGGQNGLGPEAGADLGALRTREMEAAARDIDLSVLWLSESPTDSVVDFGFSKHAEETLAKWGEGRVLARLVEIIRRERPDIVCPTFLDVPGQHGHHRAMTEAVRRAVSLAADPAAHPEQIARGLRPWQVAKLYLPAWSGAGQSYDDEVPPPNATVLVDTGAFDAVNGATYAQIAQWSRAAHATQGMGRWVDAGPDSRPLHLLWSRTGSVGEEASVLDGLPRRLGDLAGRDTAPELRQALADADEAVARTLETWPDAPRTARAAAAALARVRAAAALCPAGKPVLAFRIEQKARQLARVMFEAAGLVVRAAAEPPVAAAGTAVAVRVHVFDGGRLVDAPPTVSLVLPAGWEAARTGPDGFALAVPRDARPSDGYRDRYDPAGGNGPVHVAIGFAIDGVSAEQAVDLEEPLQVVPAVAVAVHPSSLLLNRRGAGRTVAVKVAATSHAGGEGRQIEIAARLPEGWQAEPERLRVALAEGGDAAAEMTFRAPGDPPAGLFPVGIEADGAPAMSVRRMGYPHTGAVVRCEPVQVRVRTADVALHDGVRVGVAGGGIDRAGHWLERLGAAVVDLDPARLAEADLAAFDCIVVGVFGFRRRPDLLAALPRLHGWVRAGGHLVTLYHRPWDNWDPERTPPARLRVGQPSLRWRVTDETAPVTHLVPDHPLLTTPNRIGPEDWAGWHKERGLYFGAEWDPVYQPLLSMADPGEAPLRGALLSAEIGRGRHTHTSLVLHHQMERLVPGAFRLMANLAGRAHPG